MKKKRIRGIMILIIILGILLLIGINYKNYSSNRRYKEIKKDVDDETVKYFKISHPYCTPGSGDFTITGETLLYQWGMDRKKLLDVDGESYCNVRIEVTCISKNKLNWDIYLKCKDYEDENYSNWEERHLFIGTILEVNENFIVVEPVEGSHESKSSDKIIIKRINTDNYVIGDKIKITYNGLVNESYPAQISATEIEIIK